MKIIKITDNFDSLNQIEIILVLLCITVFIQTITLIWVWIKNKNENINRHNQENISHQNYLQIQLGTLQQNLTQHLSLMLQSQKNSLDSLSVQINQQTSSNDSRFEAMRQTVDAKLEKIRNDNGAKLEAMRVTVEEKLHGALEKRLGESFKMVSERLETVHHGLGEMQKLAVGVGDLKRVLNNVKTRGIFGEVQLEGILEQILTPSQYSKNVAVKPKSTNRVEFAIKLPGREEDGHIWMAIDAKFPLADYQKLCEAQEINDTVAIELQSKLLENAIRREAKTIAEKYIAPPYTTDFAILFLPTEGLYAEVLRRPGLVDGIQREFKIVVAGPTTFSAILNSLQMGFRTLAIEKRSGEVWNILDAVRVEFANFIGLLSKTRIKLEQAGQSIMKAERKSLRIDRRLKGLSKIKVKNKIADEVDLSNQDLDIPTKIAE